MGPTTQKIHGNSTDAKGTNAHGAPVKTMFDNETEPLGLSIAEGADGVELHKDGVPVVPPDGFPEHYADEAARLKKRIRKAWYGHPAAEHESFRSILQQAYEAVGSIEYRIKATSGGPRLPSITGRLAGYFCTPDWITHGSRTNAPGAFGWCKDTGFNVQGVKLFRKTAKDAADAALAEDEIYPALNEAYLWLAMLHELASNPYRKKDTAVFASYCVRKIEERAGGASK